MDIFDFIKKPCVKRAIRTFFQAAAGYVVTNIVTADLDQKNAAIGLAGAAIAAGIAAAMNINEKPKDEVEKEEPENE